jgi:hypothetical protein
MLPVAAAVMTADPPYKQGEPCSLLHSACLVSCPAAMLHVILKMEPAAYRAVRSKDLRAGRYPLRDRRTWMPPMTRPRRRTETHLLRLFVIRVLLAIP